MNSNDTTSITTLGYKIYDTDIIIIKHILTLTDMTVCIYVYIYSCILTFYHSINSCLFSEKTFRRLTETFTYGYCEMSCCYVCHHNWFLGEFGFIDNLFDNGEIMIANGIENSQLLSFNGHLGLLLFFLNIHLQLNLLLTTLSGILSGAAPAPALHWMILRNQI